MSRRALSLLLTLAAALWSCTPVFSFDGDKIVDYGKACKAELGPLPLTWDCLKGAILAIDPDPAIDKKPCATPPWLPLDGDRCVRGARLLKLDTGRANTEVRVICRRYAQVEDFETNKNFEDVAVVGHNTDSGKTCFFQARAGNGKLLDGTDVPSPMADPNSPNAEEAKIGKRAEKYWFTPSDLDEGSVRCSRCHDNDAWMHTPYIDQVTGEHAVPSTTIDTWKGAAIDVPSKYSLVEQDYFVTKSDPEVWPQPIAVLTAKVRDGHNKVEPQVCIDCHRIANEATKDTWVDWATANPTNITDERKNLDWEHYRWMPQLPAENEDDWKLSYAKHLKAMTCCLQHPDYNGCASMPIFDIKAGDTPTKGNASKGVCIDDTGDVAFNLKLDKALVAGRGETEDSCEAPFDKPVRASFTIAHTTVAGNIETPRAGPGRSFGAQIPEDDPGLVANAQLFPGDRMQLSLLDTTAWDKNHHLLKFERWTDPASTEGTAKACPCEDPTNPVCKFATLGASDWFGRNPSRPEFPGDPPRFECVAKFVSTGDCKKVDHGSVPEDRRKIGGAVNCDCVHVSAGLLTGAFIDQCRQAEAYLQERVADGSFHIEANAENKIVSGDVCDSVAVGPSGWPVSGGPVDPPPPSDGPVCRYVGGLIQYACE